MSEDKVGLDAEVDKFRTKALHTQTMEALAETLQKNPELIGISKKVFGITSAKRPSELVTKPLRPQTPK